MAWIFHYTSRAHAQSIRIDGHVVQGESGFVYLTPDLYDLGEAAADRLSIIGKAAEMVFAVRYETETDLGFRERGMESERVLRIRLGGKLIRRGGGAEIRVPAPVALESAPLLPLRSP